MKIILNKDVLNLGEEGDVREVKPGFARNYLLPKGLVLEYNARNVAAIESRRAKIEARKQEKRGEALTLKSRLEAEALVIKMMAGENGRLFGAVTAASIVEELAKHGITIERKRIDVPDNSIKSVGNYKVGVRLYGGQEATVAVNVLNAKAVEEAAAAERAQVEKAAAAKAAAEKKAAQAAMADEAHDEDGESFDEE